MTAQEHQQVGTQLYEQGQYAAALEEFSKAILAGESSDVWNDWSMAQLACGNRVEAEKGFRRAMEQDPGNATAAMNLVVLLSKLGRSPEAVPYLEVAAKGLSQNEQQGIASLVETIKALQQPQARAMSAPKSFSKNGKGA
jgi:Tfp pilus assembly protein PilF